MSRNIVLKKYLKISTKITVIVCITNFSSRDICIDIFLSKFFSNFTDFLNVNDVPAVRKFQNICCMFNKFQIKSMQVQFGYVAPIKCYKRPILVMWLHAPKF